MFLSEDRFEVVRIDYGVASIPLFRINIPLSSESIWFCAKMTRVESDNKVELREVLRPLCVIVQECEQTLARVRISWTYISIIIISLQQEKRYRR